MIIFVGGSRAIRSLPTVVAQRLESAISKRAAFVVGDANGADKAFQQHLERRSVRDVTVFCAKGGPRNNTGGWPVEEVVSAEKRKTYEFYTAKDRAMAARADAGLVVWDEHSKGTLLQAWRLAVADKHVALYVATRAEPFELKGPEAWERFMAQLDAPLREELGERMDADAGRSKSLFGSTP
jgi:hypothetical protein